MRYLILVMRVMMAGFFTLDQMKLISDAFERRHQRSVESAVKSALSGSEEMAVLALLSDPIDFYCKTLKVVQSHSNTYNTL